MAEATPDGKTNVLNVKRMQLEGQDEIYAFPQDKQALSLHPVLLANPTINSTKKVLTTRNSYRNPFIKLTPEIMEVYLDDAGNPYFDGELLEEFTVAPSYYSTSSLSSSEHVVQQSQEPQKKSLSSITKDIVLEKFNGSNRNPVTWIDTLESECDRLEISVERICEVLRLFVEGPASEWYTTNRTLLGTATWEKWRNTFLNTFSCRGWSQVCSAIHYRYIPGSSVNEYVIKKLALLVDWDPKLSQNAKIGITVAGLPPFIREKLDRGEIDTIDKLFAKINLLDKPTKASPSNINYPNKPQSSFRRFNPSKRSYFPCSYCEKRGFPGRMHFETDCRFKIADVEKKRNETKPLGNDNNNKSSNKNHGRLVNVTQLEQLISNNGQEEKN